MYTICIFQFWTSRHCIFVKHIQVSHVKKKKQKVEINEKNRLITPLITKKKRATRDQWPQEEIEIPHTPCVPA